MTRKSIAIILSLGIYFLACKSTEKSTKKIVEPSIVTFDGTGISTTEFDYVYKKNNLKGDDAYTEKSVREYLDLYTNFRLKVREAESLGYDTTKEFLREFKEYEKQLAEPYLTEKSVTEKIIKEAYDRMTKEVNASHILIRLDENSTPTDTLNAYKTILNYRKMVVEEGSDFATIAKKFSQDPSAKQNGGNLGYFTALQMVYPFENAAYNTKVGEVSMPVRTRFGYHIVKVHDVRAARGQVKVAHIMVRASEGMDEEDIKNAESKIKQIHSELSKGANWNDLCEQFSEDGNTATKGGELAFFGTGQMPLEFEDASFSLSKNGEISQPTKTAYGWHIIKLIDKKPIENFESAKSMLEQRISRDSRAELPKEAFMNRIKKENSFIEDKVSKQLIMKMADSTFLLPEWTYDDKKPEYSKMLFSVAGKKYSVNDFLIFVKTQMRPRNVAPEAAMSNMYMRYIEQELINYEKSILADKYIDYRMLLKEYRDGILLFKLMDERVWNKAVQDTAGLRVFFNTNRNNYRWDTRATATIINAVDDATLTKVKSDLKVGKYVAEKHKINPILFAEGKSEFNSATQPELDKVVGLLNSDDRLFVILEGHTDNKANDATSNKIAMQRVENASKYLQEKGISTQRITMSAYGKTKPVADNKTPDGRAKNNRVAIQIYTSSPKVLEDKYNTDKALTLQVTEGKFQKGDNNILDEVEWEIGEYQIEKEGRKILVMIKEIEQPIDKTLAESRGLVISDYQNHLEKEWVKTLRQRYNPLYSEEEIKKIISK